MTSPPPPQTIHLFELYLHFPSIYQLFKKVYYNSFFFLQLVVRSTFYCVTLYNKDCNNYIKYFLILLNIMKFKPVMVATNNLTFNTLMYVQIKYVDHTLKG